MKQAIILFLFVGTTLYTFGQSGKLKKADNYYNKIAYSYAATIYEQLIGSEVDSPTMQSKLAMCYYHMGEMQAAQKYFAGMIESKDATPDNYFYYAQALKQNGNYQESDKWMEKFHNGAVADIRGVSFVSNPSYVETIEKQGNHFTIKNLACNSNAADFGGYNYVSSGNSASINNVYFVSARTNRIPIQNEWSWNSKRFLDLYMGSADAQQELSDLKLITKKVNTRFHEGPLCFSQDGKTVYFTRNNVAKGGMKRDTKGIQNLKLYVAEVLADGSWSNEKEVPFNSRDYSVGHPCLSSDGKTMYFASDMPGGFGGADLYKTSINADGTFGTPVNLGKEINTEGQEMFPWINAEGYLFFSSNGHIGLGGLDIFVLFPSKDGGFENLMNVGKPVNSQKDDFGLTMNTDLKTGYFSSNRDGGKGDDDIYAYQLIKPFKINYTLSGIVTDKQNNEILAGATVELKDENGNTIATTIADENGHYFFDLEGDKTYTIAVTTKDYFDNSATVSTVGVSSDMASLNQNIGLEKDPGLSLRCLITDNKTNIPLEGVTIKITDITTGKEFLTSTTGSEGDVLKAIADKKMGDMTNFKIDISKEGYLPKTVVFNQKISQPGTIQAHEKIDLTLNRPDVGMDLSTLIDIKPIYFDLGKDVIRPDAAKELDKIVKVMTDYPTMVIELGSHTDCRGSITSNTALSDRRAKASAAYIQAKITNPERIYGKGYGESKLKVNCPCEGTVKSTCPETEHQKNRRTEFIIIKM
jgi:outer membrane protein OmpA-like peptidoglycan-associated protein